jgi:hypothetical protein
MRVAMQGSWSRRPFGRVRHGHSNMFTGHFTPKILLGSVRGYRWLGRGWVALRFTSTSSGLVAFVRERVPWSWTSIACGLRRRAWQSW